MNPTGQVLRSRLSHAGMGWAFLTVIIWGMWPVYTRLGLIGSLRPDDLVALRFGISGLLLLPFLLKTARHISRPVWIEGVLLATCQGAPFVLLLAIGLMFAPANHAPALTTGLMPLFAAILGLVFFRCRIDLVRLIGLTLILCGALILPGKDLFTGSAVLFGDFMFVCASIMAATYALRAGRLGLSAIQGAGIVCVYSMVGYLPAYIMCGGAHRLWEAPTSELVFQATYQGVLMGTLSMFTFNKAIGLLGAPTASAFVSLVPVVATLIAIPVLHEIPSLSELTAIVAISCGVLVATGLTSREPAEEFQ